MPWSRALQGNKHMAKVKSQSRKPGGERQVQDWTWDQDWGEQACQYPRQTSKVNIWGCHLGPVARKHVMAKRLIEVQLAAHFMVARKQREEGGQTLVVPTKTAPSDRVSSNHACPSPVPHPKRV